MKSKLLLLLLLFSISLSAKKFPKWKDGNFKTTASGLQYKIVKKGRGDSIGKNDSVVVEYTLYSGRSDLKKFSNQKLEQRKFGFYLGGNLPDEGFNEAVMLLKEHGSGYFIFPIDYNRSNPPATFYFIRVVKVFHNYKEFIPIVTPIDTTVNISIHIPDPDLKNFGDTLFTTVTLVETPMKVSCHGVAPVLQAVKFQITYFDHGSKHKDILLFIECPDGYGIDYFVPGKSYVILGIPLMENHKAGHQVQNSYSTEQLESYYCLKVTKMN